MSKIGVNLKIDVTNIEKARLFQGQKGTYLDAMVFIDLDQEDQYGNHGMIVQAVTKDEKDQGIKGPILGNAKIFWRDQNSIPQQQVGQAPQQQGGFNNPPPAPQQPAPGGFDDFDDEPPF